MHEIDYFKDYSSYNNLLKCYEWVDLINCWWGRWAENFNWEGRKWLEFNWISDYLKTFEINNIKSIILYINIIDYLDSWWKYLLDARSWIDNSRIAKWSIWSNITKLNINGNDVLVNRNNIPEKEWAQIYIEYSTNFSDNLNIMSRNSDNEYLDWIIDELRIYNRVLSEKEINILYNSMK